MALNFENYSQKAYEFVKEVAKALSNAEDTEHAGRVIVPVFHAIRDVITPEESMHLIAQLPQNIADLWEVEEYEAKQQQASGEQP